MNRNKIAALIFAVLTVCVVPSQSKNVCAKEHKESSKLDENNQSRSIKKGQVINVSTKLRIRKSPNINSDITGYLYNGEVFNIDSKEGSWHKINANGKVGYVHKDYVKEVDGSLSSENRVNIDTSLAGKKGNVTNVSTSLRVRKSPSTNSSILGNLRNGQNLDIKGVSGDWYYVEVNGVLGYAHKDYVKIGGSNLNNNGQVQELNSGMDTKLAGKTGKVINVSTFLRVRKSPSANSSVIGSLSSGETFKIKGKSGSWYSIDSKGKSGNVHEDYVQVVGGNQSHNSPNNNKVENLNYSLDESCNGKSGKVVNVTTKLRLRSKPYTNSSILACLLPNESFTLKGETSSGWFKVSYNGKVGYLNKDYVKIVSSTSKVGENTNITTGGRQVNQSKYNKVLNVMKSQLGSPYIYGGSGEKLTSGLLSSLKRIFQDHNARGFYNIQSNYLNGNYRAFDCSGLMQWSFRQAGISLGRTTMDQINSGHEVSPRDAKPGDLLFFKNLGHVGMYIGDGKWIEAPNKGKFVSITSVPWSRIGRARRVL